MTSMTQPRSLAAYRDEVLGRILLGLGAEVPAWLMSARKSASVDRADGQTEPPGAALGPIAGLDDTDARILVACGLIESDIRFGSLFAGLQQPLAARRPCVGLISWLLGDRDGGTERLQERCHDLVNRGLLAVDNLTDPRSEWTLRIPVAVWDLLARGRVTPTSLPPGLAFRPRESFPDLRDVILAGMAATGAGRLPGLVASGEVSAVVLRGMDGSGRCTLLGAVARELGRDVLVYDQKPGGEAWQLLAALSEVGDVFPVLVADPGPGETLRLPALPGSTRPLGIVLGRSGTVSGPAAERAVAFTLGPCGAAERTAAWLATGRAIDAGAMTEITGSFLMTPGSIYRAAELAGATAAADQRTTITTADVRAASRFLQRQVLESYTTRLDPLADRQPPALSAAAAAELSTLVSRCRHRERLAAGAGGGALRGTVNRGVRALFSGPSGTGKTLTARYLAAQLHVDVYRIDLGTVVSKYIGETERNLDHVFARAEELDVVLLLDEGDALMTRRTDVSTANDRYANLETNFLLQRLETFTGIAVITTNAGSRIDTAFLRRIDVTIDFTPPDADLRWQLWLSHLPPDHQASPALLQDISRRCAFTGGQIRNAALHATLLSYQREGAVEDQDVVAAVQREYRRTGASSPLAG
jgi:ATPase family associated with various cellular activities (AAA)